MAKRGTLTVRIVGDTKPFEKAVGGLGGITSKAMRGVAGAFTGIAAGIGLVSTASGKAAASFEQAFAGVRKTLDVSGLSAEEAAAEFDRIAQGLRDMATEVPTSVEELTRVAELAGQLGVGRDAILDFTRTITEIGVASNLTTEEAATALAQFANIMGTPETETRRLGDAIINLGNNLATTESSILDFGLRIAGAGEIAGLTEEQVFAIGAAMSSVGVEAEAGGTSVQKVLLGITEAVATGNDKLKVFAETAGVSASDFKKMWEEDAAEAFEMFVEGLGAAGTDAFQILKDLGLTDQRLTRAFLSLAGAGDLLETSFDLAEDSTGALAREAQTFFDTTSNQWQTFKNTVKDAGITIGNAMLPTIKELVQGARDWVKANGPLIESIGEKLAGAIAWAVDKARDLAPIFGAFFDIVKGLVTGDLAEVKDGFMRLPEGLQPVGQFLIEVVGFVRDAVDWFGELWDQIHGGAGPVTDDMSGLASAFFILTGPMALIVRELLPALAPLIGAIVPPLADMANNLAPILAEVLAVLAETIIPPLVTGLETLTTVIREHPELIWAAVAAFAAFKTITLIGLAAKAIPAVLGALSKLTAAFMANPWALAAAAVAALVTLIVTHWDEIVAAVSAAWDWIKETAASIWEKVKDIVRGVADFLIGIFQNWTLPGLIMKHWDTIKEGVTNVKNWIVDRWNDILDFFRRIPERIGRIASGMFDSIREAFRSVVNGIIEAWNRIDLSIGPFVIPDWVPAFGGKGFHIKDIFPDIPKLHSGGVFRAPTPGGEGLALLRDEEIVVPEGAHFNGGGDTIINFFTLTRDDFVREVRRAGIDAARLGWT
ncbi:MAG TPA: phage tail tape measure protein [Acidimicrobiia bacterium]